MLTDSRQSHRSAHRRIGGLLLALGDDPHHVRNWARGADGEAEVARRLAKLLKPGTLVLHDRAMPGSRANIDHIAVAPSGVWVIDSKSYKGKKIEVRTPLLGRSKLMIAGRDKTKLIDGLARQVELVAREMACIAPGVPVRGAVCFADAELPIVFKLSLRGFPILYPKQLAKRINRPGPIGPDRIRDIAGALVDRLPAA